MTKYNEEGATASSTISPETAQMIAERNLVVLRENGSGKALNVSYTSDGLRYTMNKVGRYIFDPRRNHVEKFEPRNFKDPFLQKCEITWLMKAIKL